MKERESLTQLSKDELISIIFELQEKIAGLKGKQKRPVKTTRNSSRPSGQSQKANQPKKRKSAKRGPKAGHEGKSRHKTEADVVIQLEVEACEQCGADLSGVEQQVVGSSQTVDLPPIQPVVIEVQRCAATCPQCEHEQAASYPAGLEAERVFGPRLEAAIHYLHLTHPLSYVRVQDILHDLFGFDISLGALVNAVRRASTTFERAAQAILADIRASAVIGSDETGARIEGQSAWLWVVQSADSAYYTIAPTRGFVVLERLMGETIPLVWVSDLAKAQLKQAAEFRQICIPHQTRDLQYAIDAERCAWAYRFQALLYHAQRLVKQRDKIPLQFYSQQVQLIEQTCDILLTLIPLSEESQNLRRRFIKHRHHLFTFLYLLNVPSSNNASEQALRNSVIYRKVTGGFRSDWGASAYTNVISVIETARRRGQDILLTLSDFLAPSLDLSPSFSLQGE